MLQLLQFRHLSVASILYGVRLGGGIAMQQRVAHGKHIVPAMVYGPADHSLRYQVGQGETPYSQWWPMLVNHWNQCGEHPNCFWCLCVDHAITASRPWPVHRSRIHILSAATTTSDSEPPVVPQDATSSDDWNGPVIEEIVSDTASVTVTDISPDQFHLVQDPHAPEPFRLVEDPRAPAEDL